MKTLNRIENTIFFNNMNQPMVGSDFIVELKDAISEGFDEINLDFSAVKNIYPNTAVPVSGIIDYFKLKYNIQFKQIDGNPKIELTHILHPLTTTNDELVLKTNPLNRVWQFFNSADVNSVVDFLVLELRKTEQFEVGVLDGLTWSLNEVMDNVLQHAQVNYGFVMGQIHKRQKHVAFCVFDNGQGIYNSLKNSIFAPKNAVEALKIAIKESVTRDKKIGQGNGMYGLNQIVKYNNGRLTVISNSAFYKLEADKVSYKTNIPTISVENGGTFVDFQLDYQNKVSIEDALIFESRPPHTEYVNYYLENLENEAGELVYILKDWRDGVGTRLSGKKLRNEILNNFRETKKRAIIDFNNLSVISSSFADELLGKLVIEFGFFNFNNIIKLKNMNNLIQQLVQRSVAQRMAESLDKPIK